MINYCDCNLLCIVYVLIVLSALQIFLDDMMKDSKAVTAESFVILLRLKVYFPEKL